MEKEIEIKALITGIAAREISRDDPSFDPIKVCGSIDTAYAMGERHGEVMLARAIKEKMGW